MLFTVGDIRKKFLDFFQNKGHEVVPSSPLVPHNDPTLMFSNAGMNQFKNVFNGSELWKNKAGNQVVRACSSQKCVRAGGKHNDLDNVGYTARHHTFFEMLGNFSFGDYFKEDAIKYAWEFLTSKDWMAIDPDKLYITIYHTDDEAFKIWQDVTGFGDDKIIRIATKDNFWEMGNTGPCGPCSEIFYDHGEQYEGGLPGTPEEDGDRYIEIWNLVFMQYEKLADGSQVALPKPCIDTGMGLERMAALKQGKNNNYETDLFKLLITKSQEVSGNAQAKFLTSHRVIADHLRTSCFLIADGVMPSNEGRGYVLRRIMRRAMRHAHILGCTEPLIYQLVDVLVERMQDAFPELKPAQPLMIEVLKFEEEKFQDTLDRGLKLLDEEVAGFKSGDILSGEVAFKLYDTYGFPLDLTQDIVRIKNIKVDLNGFKTAMDEQKNKARAAWSGSGETATDEVWFALEQKYGATKFLGYSSAESSGRVIALIKDGQQVDKAQSGDEISVLTNQTVFYAQSGGQSGDQGVMQNDNVQITVTDTKKQLGKLHLHICQINQGELQIGDELKMKIDGDRRQKLNANHSVTHLLHAALRNCLGQHVMQKGSLVEADYFRFDFSNPVAIEKNTLQQIEQHVNNIISQGGKVITKLMTPEQAVEQGAMALFGEKYGDEVRVVAMGKGGGDKAFSVELCGGTHVADVAEIVEFKIIKESSAAASIRRIEGRTGAGVVSFLKEQGAKQAENAKVKQQQEQQKAQKAQLIGGFSDKFIAGIDDADKIDDIVFYAVAQEGVSPKDLRGLVDSFKQKVVSGVVVIIACNGDKVGIVVGVTDSLSDKINAVDLVRIGSQIIGGKGGGGRPDFAQAGGNDSSKAQQAIAAIKQAI